MTFFPKYKYYLKSKFDHRSIQKSKKIKLYFILYLYFFAFCKSHLMLSSAYIWIFTHGSLLSRRTGTKWAVRNLPICKAGILYSLPSLQSHWYTLLFGLLIFLMWSLWDKRLLWWYSACFACCWLNVIFGTFNPPNTATSDLWEVTPQNCQM